jgi:hypothetical protein
MSAIIGQQVPMVDPLEPMVPLNSVMNRFLWTSTFRQQSNGCTDPFFVVVKMLLLVSGVAVRRVTVHSPIWTNGNISLFFH